jgi:hypothetical protein
MSEALVLLRRRQQRAVKQLFGERRFGVVNTLV